MSTENRFLQYNGELKSAIAAYHQEKNYENLRTIVNVLDKCMRLDGHFLIPVETEPDEENPERTHYWMREIDTQTGRYLAAFTDEEELHKGQETAVISFFVDALFEKLLLTEGCQGVVINPWGEAFYLTRQFMKLVLILSQLRKMYGECQTKGENYWENAEISKERQAMYYSMMQDSLGKFQEYDDLGCFYWEIVALFKDIFVTYWYDKKEACIYQISASGEGYMIKKDHLRWESIAGKDFSALKQIGRKEAEEMEEQWNEAFWRKVEDDLRNGEICLCSSECRSLNIRIFNQEITLAGEDFGEECYRMSGKRVYEYYYNLKAEQTRHLIAELREAHGLENTIAEILQKEFGGNEGAVKFRKYCEKIGERPGFFCF